MVLFLYKVWDVFVYRDGNKTDRSLKEWYMLHIKGRGISDFASSKDSFCKPTELLFIGSCQYRELSFRFRGDFCVEFLRPWPTQSDQYKIFL